MKKKVEIKYCAICNKEIKSDDHYIRLTDYKNGEFYMEGFYHNPCYHKKIDEAISRNRKQLVDASTKAFEKLGIKAWT